MSKAMPKYIVEPGGPTSIDLRKMPKPDARRMGNALLVLAREFFEDPENRCQCEEWKASERGGASAQLRLK